MAIEEHQNHSPQTTSQNIPEDNKFENKLRPKYFNEYVGQDKIKENLKIFIQAAKKRKEPLEHVLLYGPPGLGKTTLAYVIANGLQTNIRATSGPAIEKVGDLGSILTNLKDGDVLFIDEIHRLNKLIEEILYPAMEDYKLDIIIGKGPSAKTIQLDLPRFTLIGATTRLSLISNPLRDRFGIVNRLDFYSLENIQKIIERSAKILGTDLNPECSQLISQRARRTPRVANRLLKRVRDFAEVDEETKLTSKIVHYAMERLDVDNLGLEPIDRQILESIIKLFNGGPVGIQSIAASISEEAETIEDVHEPYLLQIGFIQRTPRGRMATKKAYEYLGIQHPEERSTLPFNQHI